MLRGVRARISFRRWCGSAVVLVSVLCSAAVAAPSPAQCTGDCNGDRHVTVDEILTLANMALGHGGSCPNGLTAGGTPDVPVILQAVNDALKGCPAFLAITSLSSTSPTPLTPLYIATTGIDPSSPVMIQFSDSAGFSASETAIRVGSEGTVVAAVPLYVDPSTGQVTSGNVTMVLTQGQKSSAPAALAIQDLPSLASLGTQLGEVSHAYMIFSTLLTQQRITDLEYVEAVTGGQLDTSAARQFLENIRTASILARGQIDRVMQDPTVVIPLGMLPDGTPLQFTRESVEMMDRVLAVWLSQLPLPIPQTGPAAAPRGPIAGGGGSSKIESVLKFIETFLGTAGSSKEVQNSTTFLDAGLALFKGIVTAGQVAAKGPLSPILGLVGAAPDVAKDTLLFSSSLTKTVEDMVSGKDYSGDIDKLKTTTFPDFSLSAVQFAAAYAALLNPEVVAVPAGVLGLGAELIKAARDGTLASVATATLSAVDAILAASEKPFNGVMIQGDVMISNGAVAGLPLSVTACCVLPSLKIDSLTDGNNQFSAPFPIQLPTSSPITLTASDPTTGTTFASTTVDISHTSGGQIVQIPTIQAGWCAPAGRACNSLETCTDLGCECGTEPGAYCSELPGYACTPCGCINAQLYYCCNEKYKFVCTLDQTCTAACGCLGPGLECCSDGCPCVQGGCSACGCIYPAVCCGGQICFPDCKGSCGPAPAPCSPPPHL